jgi:hypothetical protein
MKKSKERNETTEFKTSNTFLSLKMMFFGPKVNLVDLVVNFSWPLSSPQSDFFIKSYGHLKLR